MEMSARALCEIDLPLISAAPNSVTTWSTVFLSVVTIESGVSVAWMRDTSPLAVWALERSTRTPSPFRDQTGDRPISVIRFGGRVPPHPVRDVVARTRYAAGSLKSRYSRHATATANSEPAPWLCKPIAMRARERQRLTTRFGRLMATLIASSRADRVTNGSVNTTRPTPGVDIAGVSSRRCQT
ncbi:MAG: hypothetical protein JWO37_1195 [Acidimicrobiales bacterium]|jgi:hypothetical protein|nr:hypothetical protein [Acidimicrobiales bacterium]